MATSVVVMCAHCATPIQVLCEDCERDVWWTSEGAMCPSCEGTIDGVVCEECGGYTEIEVMTPYAVECPSCESIINVRCSDCESLAWSVDGDAVCLECEETIDVVRCSECGEMLSLS